MNLKNMLLKGNQLSKNDKDASIPGLSEQDRKEMKILLDASCLCKNIFNKDEKEKVFNDYISKCGMDDTYYFDLNTKLGTWKKVK